MNIVERWTDKKKRRKVVSLASRRLRDVTLGNIHPPVFAVGTGRSGTHFISKVMDRDESFLSVHLDHLRSNAADSFIAYCVWNNIAVDFAPYLDFRRSLIQSAARSNRIYLEANPYVSLMSKRLHEELGARLLFIVRNPEDVVNSHFMKGWYKELPDRSDPNRPPGPPPGMPPHHFFGRLTPNGEAYGRWMELTRIGKISWWWNTLNVWVNQQLRELPQGSYQIVRLEQLSYDEYKKVSDFAGGRNPLTRKAFDRIRRRRPGRGKKRRGTDSWTDQELEEFLVQTKEARGLFGYPEPGQGK